MSLPPFSDSVTTRLRSSLLAAGLRVTRQRVAVYDHLIQLDHPTVEEVYRRVRDEIASVSLATIYTALDALVASGLVRRLATENGSTRYDARLDHHYHLRCSRSGALVDLDTRFDPELIAKIDPGLDADLHQRGFRVTGYRLEVVGYFEDQGPSAADDEPS